jgi:hypothetical protein
MSRRRELGAMRITAVLVVFVVACGGPLPDIERDAGPSDDAAARDTFTIDAASVDAARGMPDAGPPPADWLAAGTFASCASRDGLVSCWGSLWNDVVEPSPVAMAELDGASQLALASGLACAVMPGGVVSCAGSNRTGALGVAPDVLPERASFAPVPGVDDAVEVAVGATFACALRRDGSVLCWGDDSLGQTGSPIPTHATGSSAAQPTPEAVAGIEDAVAISAGEYHACALRSGGSVRCWGYDWYGALGRGAGYTGMPQSVAADVEGLTDALDVVSDTNSSCAIRADGTLVCWGAILPGLPGFDAATSDYCTVVVEQNCWRAPRALPGIADVRELSMGGGGGCVRATDAWQCWGRDDYGQVTGDGSAPATIDTVAVGGGHLCVRDEAGSIACRGRGQEGQLGDGRSTSSRALVTVALP